MNFFISAEKILNKLKISDVVSIEGLSPKMLAIILAYLNPDTYTGTHTKTIKEIAKKDISLLTKLTNVELFPEIYKNPALTDEDVLNVEDIRLTEYNIIYEQIKRGEDLVIPSYWKWGSPDDRLVFYFPPGDEQDNCQTGIYENFTYRYCLENTFKNILPNNINDYMINNYRRELAILNFDENPSK